MRESEIGPLLSLRASVMQRADFLDEILGLENKPPELEVENGIATIRIHGAIGMGLAAWEKAYCGMVDVGDVATLVGQAAGRGDVKAIMLHICSPGGSVLGITEAASKIYAARAAKPVITYARGLMASAGYWLGAQASAVIASTSSIIGSIGVFSAMWDDSKAVKDFGYRRVLVASGPHKGLPQPGIEIDEEQVAAMRERVMDYAEMFFGDVQRARGGAIPADAFSGADWVAARAFSLGLVDQIIDDEADAVKSVLGLV